MKRSKHPAVAPPAPKHMADCARCGNALFEGQLVYCVGTRFYCIENDDCFKEAQCKEGWCDMLGLELAGFDSLVP